MAHNRFCCQVGFVFRVFFFGKHFSKGRTIELKYYRTNLVIYSFIEEICIFIQQIYTFIIYNIYTLLYIILYIREMGREGGREGRNINVREKHQLTASCKRHNLGMCPNWESNP